MKDARVARYIFAAKSLGVVRGIGRCGMRGQLSIARAMTGAMNVIACARDRGEWASGCADHGPSTSKASSTVRSPFSRRIQPNLTDSPVHSRARVNTPCTGPPSERVVSCYDVYSLFSLLRQDIGAGYPPIISEKCRIWEERKLRRRRRTSEIKDAFGPVLRTVFVPSNLRTFFWCPTLMRLRSCLCRLIVCSPDLVFANSWPGIQPLDWKFAFEVYPFCLLSITDVCQFVYSIPF